jgi:hypothetical protein
MILMSALTLARAEGLTPAVISALYFCGHIQHLADDGSTSTLVIAFEQNGRTLFVKDFLPPVGGSTIHRLWDAISGGFSTRAADVRVGELLGRVVLADFILSETVAALRRVRPWPTAPKYFPPAAAVWTSSDRRLTGGNGERVIVGGMMVNRGVQPEYPKPPQPTGELEEWNIADLRGAHLPVTLPRIVRELAMRSSEWLALEAKGK